ncbi:hypothetical protein FQN55_009166 [Onygenales sp. PD_40]|nr:hypothetical protein FQN55_009166 [Onygenales sp. PD_40]KAK2779867.1 hypothetical protein FQN52_002347 [Onygenales sp. PD_12]KAK2788704.1 hypothetical protein FQN53_003213 [Emmonsiellopsis sp. PD_33]KAK2800796.1 hypothetical protein FQN51_005936 [Onygenales sp. PD_10]
MSKSRMPMYLGLAVAGAGGYYLYSAGGDPKRATRKFENDASRAGSKIRGEAGKAVGTGEKVGAHIDEAAEKAKRADERAAEYAKEGVQKIEKVGHETAVDVNAKIDAFDKEVEQKAAEAKKGVSSWFGGKK